MKWYKDWNFLQNTPYQEKKTIKGRRKNAEETDEIIWQTLMAEEAVGYTGV